MAAEFPNVLDWADWMYKRLCQHVLQHGDQQWEQLSQELKCPVKLLQLKWHVLLVRAAQKYSGHGTKKQPQWEIGGWELGVLWRILRAFLGTVYVKARAHEEIASWLPGRTAQAVKLAKYLHIEKKKAKTKPAVPMTDEFPETVLETLMAWPGVHSHYEAYMQLPARQMAEYLLYEEPQLMTTAPGSKAAAGQTTSRKREREDDLGQEASGWQQQQTEQAAANMDLLTYQTQYLGAAAAGGTINDFLLPPGRFSPGLSSSSSMASIGTAATDTPATSLQDLPTLQQLLPQGAPSSPKRSRLSQSTAVQRSMQQESASAAAAAAESFETVPGHVFGAYNMLGHAAFWSQPWVLVPVVGTSGGKYLSASTTEAAAAEAAAGPSPLMRACWASLDSATAGVLTCSQLTDVPGLSSVWYGGQQLQPAEACGLAPAVYAAAGDQAWLPRSTVAAPASQQPQLSSPPAQQDSLVLGAAGTASSGEVTAGSGGALAAAAAVCETDTMQMPAHTALPDCQHASESSLFTAHPFRKETVDCLHTAYKAWVQQEQDEKMTGFLPSIHDPASASPDASTNNTGGLFGLTKLLVSNADSVEMVDMGDLVFEDLDSISEKFSESDELSDLETELGIGDWLEL